MTTAEEGIVYDLRRRGATAPCLLPRRHGSRVFTPERNCGILFHASSRLSLTHTITTTSGGPSHDNSNQSYRQASQALSPIPTTSWLRGGHLGGPVAVVASKPALQAATLVARRAQRRGACARRIRHTRPGQHARQRAQHSHHDRHARHTLDATLLDRGAAPSRPRRRLLGAHPRLPPASRRPADAAPPPPR